MRELDSYGWAALIIVLIGGLNWALIGLLNLNLVTAIFGVGFLSRLIFIIVGIATVYICYLIYLEKFKK